ncbi:uncharacterized protein [Antedon mediterranea]|uniref:uncharacterized protein n=1 Tax=Antedon mediterranea TaxID=105859 RepID=UPI003AF8E440
MSFENYSKKRPLEDDFDHNSKPRIDDFCRKKFKPIAPKPTLKKDQHQAVVLATLPVKSSFLEENDGCKFKHGAAPDSGKQMLLMSPPHMHVMSNLPVMLHTPTLVAMNSCNTMPVLANYSFVIPVGCGHCNCGKSNAQPIICTKPTKNTCHCHNEPCCKKDIERTDCKSCDCSSNRNCCLEKNKDGNYTPPYKGKSAQVPILPLNASLPSNIKDILKLRPEKYKYSMLLNSPGTYSQIAEKTARQNNSFHLMNWSVASEKQLATPVTSSCESSPHFARFSSSVAPSLHSNSMESYSSKHSRSHNLSSAAPLSKPTSVPTHVPASDLSSNSTKERTVNPPDHQSKRCEVEPEKISSKSVSASNRNTVAENRTLNSMDSSPNISFETQINPTNNSSLPPAPSSLVPVTCSISSAVHANIRNNFQISQTVPSNQRSASTVEKSHSQKPKKTSSVEFLSVSSRAVASMPEERTRPETECQNRVNPSPQPSSINGRTAAMQSHANTSITTLQNTRMSVSCPMSNDNIVSPPPMQRLSHKNPLPPQSVRPICHQTSVVTPTEIVASEKTSEQSGACGGTSEHFQVSNSTLTGSRSSTSTGRNLFSNSIVNTSSSTVGRIDSIRDRQYITTTLTNSNNTSQAKTSERLTTGIADTNFQTRSRTSEHSSAPTQLNSSAGHNVSFENRGNSDMIFSGTGSSIRNFPIRPNEERGSGSSNNRNVICPQSSLQSKRTTEYLNRPHRENVEKSPPMRNWSQMISQAHGSNMVGSCPRDYPSHTHQRNNLIATAPWTDIHREQNHTNTTSKNTCRQPNYVNQDLPTPTSKGQLSNNSDSTHSGTVQSSSTTIQTVPLISNLPSSSSKFPSNSAITKKSKPRCPLLSQESITASNESTLNTQPRQVEHSQNIRTSCNALGSHTPTRVHGSRVTDRILPGMNKRLSHNPLVQSHPNATEQQINQPGVLNHAVSDLNLSLQSRNPPPRPMLYNFPHMLNSQSDVPHRFPSPGGLGRHAFANHHMSHLQECNLSTPHTTPHPSLHQPSSRHLLVPPPPFSTMHRSLFMSPSPHPPDVNLMSPRSFPSTHLHDNLLYSPASIPRLPTTPSFSDRLHSSYPLHYLPEDRTDSCCSGGIRTSHSPTTNSFNSPWLLSSPSRTSAQPYFPSLPRHNSFNNLSSSQDFNGFGSSLNMNNISSLHHMPGCRSEMNIQHHSEPLHIQTDIQAERDATGSSQLSPIVTPPPAAETLSRRPLRSTSSSESLIHPLINTASESIANLSARRNLIANPNTLFPRNTLQENQMTCPTMRRRSSEIPQLPTRRPSSEHCVSRNQINTTALNQPCDKNSEKSNSTTAPISSAVLNVSTASNSTSRQISSVPTPSVQPPSVQPPSNTSLPKPSNQEASLPDTPSQVMPPSPATQRTNNKYLPIDESNPVTSQAPSVAPSPTQSVSDQPVKFNGVTLQCSRQILCESGRTVLCCWNCDFHTAEPKKMHRHQRKEDKLMRCQLCSFTGNSRCNVDQHFKENHLGKDDPFTSTAS